MKKGKRKKNREKQEEEQEQQHTSSSWPVIICTLSDIITINFSLYFKRLKLHGTHCICTTWLLYKKIQYTITEIHAPLNIISQFIQKQFFSVLWHCWLSDRKDIQPVQKDRCWFVGGNSLSGGLHILQLQLSTTPRSPLAPTKSSRERRHSGTG